MRTTLELPDGLVREVMKLTSSKTKTEAIKFALEMVIKQWKRRKLINYKGKIDLDIDLDTLRDRS